MGAPPSSEIVRKSKIDAGRERDAGAVRERDPIRQAQGHGVREADACEYFR